MKILLKISGEALKGNKDFGIDDVVAKNVASMIKEIKNTGVRLAIVIGGGNIYRGGNLIQAGVEAADSHNLSMLSTVFNGVVLKNFLEQIGIETVVMDPNGVKFVETYSKENAKKYIDEGKVVIFTGGTGNPYFTTDTGGVLRALEIGADFMIKATRVDGVYDSDPEKNPSAKMFEEISYSEVLEKDLKVMDLTAIVLAKENNLKVRVVNLFKDKALLNAVKGKKEGSIIS
ncbi:MAG: UMP kinase [Candidatus Gracilibacteria bacterium]|nr:UMP kinase [Candidatus Gracilibacteria bacterium]